MTLAEINYRALLEEAAATVVVIFIATAVWVVLSRALKSLEKRARISKTLLLPLRLVLRYGIAIVAIILIVSAYGIPIGNFWTFVSTILGLVAIGFVAVWSVLSNISATFFILIFKPFTIGDYVRIVGDDVRGVILDVNFMFTTIRSHRGDVFTVPNNQFFQKATVQPADNGRDELEEKPTPHASAKSIDHSQQNLEGIEIPGVGRGPQPPRA